MSLLRKVAIASILLLIGPKVVLAQISDINKTTGWYMTNECYQGQVDVQRTNFSGFNLNFTPYYPYQWDPNKEYYWALAGEVTFCDLDNDGINNLVQSYYRSPWPESDKKGLTLHSNTSLSEENYTVQLSLTQVRKQVVTDFNNDGINEVLLISHGKDSEPFPGDSVAIYHIDSDTLQYLSDNVGYYHGGTVGDLDNDGDQDIILGFGETPDSKLIDYPTVYINEGEFQFNYDNSNFVNFPQQSEPISWFTVELYDLNGDGWLDLFVQGIEYDDEVSDSFYIIYNEQGVFDYNNHIKIDTPYGSYNSVMDFDFYDFNSDGFTDILINSEVGTYQSGESFIYINENNTSFVNKTQDFTTNGLKGIPGLTWWAWNYLYDIDKDGDTDIVPQGLYGFRYRQKQYFYFENIDGVFTRRLSTPITSGYYTNTEEETINPSFYSLNQNYPNPFNPTTSITYSLPHSAVVSLKIYDITGKYITTLVDGVTSAGIHTVTFDAGSLSSGMYVYTLESDGFRQSKQMMLVK